MSSRRANPKRTPRRAGSPSLTLLALLLLLFTTFGEAGHLLEADHSAFQTAFLGSSLLVFPAAAHPWDTGHMEDAGEEASREECPICLHRLRSVSTLPAPRPTLACATPPSLPGALPLPLPLCGSLARLGPRAPPAPLPC